MTTVNKQNNLLSIRPVQIDWAKQSTSGLMVEAMIIFLVSSQWRIQSLSLRSDPVKNGTLKTLCVVSPGTGHSLVKLSRNENFVNKNSERLAWSAIYIISSSDEFTICSSMPGIVLINSS